MKANELRIGNYVYSVGCNGEQIESTITSIVKAGDLIAMCENRFVADEPIPLTEEWLEKFGFEESINDYYELRPYKISKDMEFMFFDVGDWYQEIKYVHQLQNLYFALTGEELKITELV